MQRFVLVVAAILSVSIDLAAGYPIPIGTSWLRASGWQSTELDPIEKGKLKKEIEGFTKLQGQWVCQGVFPSNGKRIESRIQFESDLEGAWLAVRHDDLPPNIFHAAEYWGFDGAQKRFVALVFDNFGGVRRFTSSGWTGDKLTWLGEPSKTSAQIPERFVYQRSGPNQLIVNWEVNKGDSGWRAGDTLTCKRGE